jgi:hypothetical protein
LKRSPLKRKTALLPRPHHTGEERRLRDDPLARSTFAAPRKPLARGKPKPRLVIPDDVKRQVRARSKGRCIVCLFDGKPKAGRAEHLHHGLPKGVHGWPHHAKKAENLMGICAKCHDLHERAIRRIPRAALPACFVEFCKRLGGRAEAYIDRTYGEA